MIAYPKSGREKPLHWVGSAKRDLLTFPEEAIDDFGYALGLVQQGGVPPSAKPWKGEGGLRGALWQENVKRLRPAVAMSSPILASPTPASVSCASSSQCRSTN